MEKNYLSHHLGVIRIWRTCKVLCKKYFLRELVFEIKHIFVFCEEKICRLCRDNLTGIYFVVWRVFMLQEIRENWQTFYWDKRLVLQLSHAIILNTFSHDMRNGRVKNTSEQRALVSVRRWDFWNIWKKMQVQVKLLKKQKNCLFKRGLIFAVFFFSFLLEGLCDLAILSDSELKMIKVLFHKSTILTQDL